MFRSILVPLDGTAQSAEALPLARTVAQATAASLHLLTVSGRQDPSSQAGATASLEAAAADLRWLGVSADTAVRVGDPSAEILKFARSRHATDLIVMSTRAVGPRSIVALTSVAQEVVAQSPCPVLLIRPGDRQPSQMRTLLVPIDGSPGGSLGLAAARALARPTASRLVLLDVVVPVPAAAFAALPGMTLGGYIDPEWEDLARTAARLYVEGVARRLKDVGVTVEARVATGDVPKEILRCANEVEADAIVMSTHAVTWPARAYVGSVADYVLRYGTRPVMLVRRESTAGESQASASQPISGDTVRE